MINAIKRAFGFSEQYSYSEELDELDKDTDAAEAAAPEPDPVPSDEASDAFLNAVLAVINSSLPPVVAEAIDSGRQRAKLRQMLGPAMDEFACAMRRMALKELTGDRAKMQTELEELRTEKKDFASKRDEQKASLLSEQRQRRALQDRNRDLEARIAELDSEIEQHKLSISSLMNKIRVAEVSEGDFEALKTSLESRVNDLKTKLEAKEAENLELSARIADLEAPKALQEALEQRKELTADMASTDADEAPRKPRRSRKRKTPVAVSQGEPSADLAEIEIVDWLLPGGAPAGHTPAGPDPDFGYQPPRPPPAPAPHPPRPLF